MRTREFIRELDRLTALVTTPPLVKKLGRVANGPSRESLYLGTVLPKPSSQSHAELAVFFEKVRSGVIDKLGGADWLKKVPAHDPLRCSIGLFETIDLSFRETAHTRMLAWLMDPSKEHGFGDVLVSVFLQKVFRLKSRPRLKEVAIRSEVITSDQKGRLDIHLGGKWSATDRASTRWEVILEAKIHADEGDEQCSRYETEVQVRRDSYSERVLVFLTPDGRPPATNSINADRPWESLSFLDLLALFRPELAALTERPGFYMIRHYMAGVLKNLYRINCGENQAALEGSNIYQISDYLLPTT